jgi:NAD(P)-dependent dehydrogenase (short-subunit alcohol dehydrogenase family)
MAPEAISERTMSPGPATAAPGERTVTTGQATASTRATATAASGEGTVTTEPATASTRTTATENTVTAATTSRTPAARFAGKVVLVTGGGSGIGRATARAFAREGATVVVAGRGLEALEATVALIAKDGGRGSAVATDVSRSEEVARLVDTTVERHGGLHVAFNNAGVLAAGSVADIDEADWNETVAVNLTGVWLAMKHEIKHMREHGGGVIVNTASNIGAHVRRPFFGAYAASKAAVSVLTRTAAREYAGDGIRINAISPGPIDTAMSLRPGESPEDRAARLADTLPAGRVGTIEEAAAAVLWLASDESGFTVGHDLVLDGGATA